MQLSKKSFLVGRQSTCFYIQACWRFFEFLLSLVTFKPVMLSLSGDNNLVPFYLWWTETLIRHKKVSKYFVQDCIKWNTMNASAQIRLMIRKQLPKHIGLFWKHLKMAVRFHWYHHYWLIILHKKMKFSIKDFFIFCAV